MRNFSGALLSSAVLAAVVSGAVQLIADRRRRINEDLREQRKRKEELYAEYLYMLSSIPRRWWESMEKGDAVLDELFKGCTQGRVDMLMRTSPKVQRAVEESHRKVYELVQIYESLGDEARAGPRDFHWRVPKMMQKAFDETLWPAVENLSAEMRKDLGWPVNSTFRLRREDGPQGRPDLRSPKALE